MKQLSSLLVLAAMSQVGIAWAQLAPVNEMGFTWGHLHLTAPDVDKETKAWLALGGQLGNNLSANIPVKFPGVLILIRPGEISGGSEGSLIDHVSFRVPDLNAAMTQWRGPIVPGKEANWGLKAEPGARAGQAFVTTPAKVKIEILEDKKLKAAIVFDHVHFYLPEARIHEIEAYYEKMYGAKPVKGEPDTLSLPGGKLVFSKTETQMATTTGRSLDHIGFNMNTADALAASMKTLEAKGAKFDRTYIMGKTRAAMVIDGFGTEVELTKGFPAYFDATYPTDDYLK